MAAAAQQPVSAQVVGNAFVQQYYHILHHSPALVHKFYHNPSKLGRPEEDGSMSITTTMDAINEKILSLNYGELKAEIKSVDAQESFNAGVTVLMTGYLTGKDNSIRNFTQSFFLAPQKKGGYYVLNDMFRYIENASLDAANEVLVSDVVHVDAPVTPEEAEPSPSQESVISEQMTVLAEEVNGEDADKPSDNGEVPVVEEEVPVAEVVEEVQDKVQMIVESDTKVEEAPKKSYASIVMDMKESGVVFSSPAPSMQKSPPKSQVQQVNHTLPAASGAEVPGSGSDAVENGNNQEGEGDGYSIYIKGLPLNATPAQLEDEFKKFGPIKSGGIQVRSNRQQGVCFGFVKYEVESAVQKAMEASPITIGGRQAVIKEKRSTNSRGKPGVPSLRETVVVDSPVVRTFATLTPFPPTAMGPPDPSPDVDALSSRPPLLPTREGGGFTSAAASAGTVPPLVDLPPFPRDILYAGAGLRRYTVPEFPISDNTFSYLGGRVGDEMVTVRAVDLRAWHARSLYNWNLLQFVGRDPTSYMDDYRRAVEVSLRTDDPVISSRMRSESQRSSCRVFRRSQSSVIRPMASARTAAILPTVPAAEVTRLVADPAPTVHPPGGGLQR